MSRVWVALGSAVLSAAVVLLVLVLFRGWPPFGTGSSSHFDLRGPSEGLEELLANRERRGAGLGGRGMLQLDPIDEKSARELFPLEHSAVVYDPDVYYRYRPHLSVEQPWEEHPDGSWLRATNGSGLREDTDDDFTGADLRILVAGDSHTDGSCNNSESFTNLLEARLAEADPSRSVVALNTGVFGYSFYNYLGALEEGLLGQHGAPPDVLVVAVYGGNDFVEVPRLFHFFRGSVMPPTSPEYWVRIDAAKRASSKALGQGLNQLAYFGEHPDQVDVAIGGCREAMGEIARLCHEREVRLHVVHIPAAFDVPRPDFVPEVERALAALGLSPDALELGRRFEAELRDCLAGLGVSYVDLTERFIASEEPCYWMTDLHINLVGHRLVAEVLQELLERQADLAPRPPEARSDGPFETFDGEGRLEARGEWKDGRRSGEWTTFHPGGTPSSHGAYEAGQRTGTWQWWYPGGQLLKQGGYEAGRPTGLFEEWYPSGVARRRGEWVDGLPKGTWETWYEDGSPASRGTYRAGKYDGSWIAYYEGGTPKVRSTWREGRQDGAKEAWYPDGVRRLVGSSADGRPEGRWTFYHPSGAVKSEGLFEGGERQGPSVFFDEEGKLDEELSGHYRKGRRVRPLAPSEPPAEGTVR